MRHKAQCGPTIAEQRLYMERLGMVERCESPEHDDRPQQPHEMEAQMEVTQSRRCLGRKDVRTDWTWEIS